MQQGAHTGSPLPTRISFFSVPVLSPGYVQLLTQVAQYIDIHVYLMNPSIEYWGDIESEKRRRKQNPEAQALTTVGNPLLASWGRQGRDFLDQLLEANAETDDTLFVETDETTLLQQLQTDILHLRMPSLLPAPLAGGEATRFSVWDGVGEGGNGVAATGLVRGFFSNILLTLVTPSNPVYPQSTHLPAVPTSEYPPPPLPANATVCDGRNTC